MSIRKSYDLTKEQVMEILSYDSQTGVFRWKHYRQSSTPAGSIAGSNCGKYRQINIGGTQYMASHLAWLIVHGRYPNGQLDHKNLNKKDDRIDNLRECTQSQNLANKRVHRNHKVGLKGVARNGGGFAARLTHNNQHHYLGTYKTPEQAHQAYVTAAKQFHGEFSRG